MTQNKTVTVVVVEEHEDGWPPTSLKDFQAWLDGKRCLIPPEFVDSAKIEIDSILSYEDSHWANIIITYERPETDEETKQREICERDRQVWAENREKTTLAYLLNKYPSAR